MRMEEEPRVYIIILNWNGWKHSIECLESLQQLNYSNYRMVLVDNSSSDDSIQHITAWANGNLVVESHMLEYRNYNKPVSIIAYDQLSAEKGGIKELEEQSDDYSPNSRLVIIQSGANLGYAGGNNVGIRYAIKRNDFDYIWILNNDTVVSPDSLKCMIQRMQTDDMIGMCGSTLLYYDQPELVQALGGGRYYKYLGLVRLLGRFTTSDRLWDIARVEKNIDFIIGASMMVSKKFIKDTGLMNEEYFLHFEELDWATRGNKYRLAYARDSIVYHKEGGSTGSSRHWRKRSIVNDYWGQKNRLVFTRNYYPLALPGVYFIAIVFMLRFMYRKQWDRANMMLKLILGFKIVV